MNLFQYPLNDENLLQNNQHLSRALWASILKNFITVVGYSDPDVYELAKIRENKDQWNTTLQK